ncbi:hypothetical protein BgiBS90_021919 [Biomphalaria glabrata]|nr:hypothetical protein BgiBS90_021919 [Biomphalaria glabrata]
MNRGIGVFREQEEMKPFKGREFKPVLSTTPLYLAFTEVKAAVYSATGNIAQILSTSVSNPDTRQSQLTPLAFILNA